MITAVDYDEWGVEQAYEAIVDLLASSGLTQTEGIVALLNVIATQYRSNISDDDARLFVEEASQWVEDYFKSEDLYAKTGN